MTYANIQQRKLLVRSIALRLLLALVAAVVAAFVAVVPIALVDLYLTGHSRAGLSREIVDWPALGVALSPADVALLTAAGGAGALAWRLTRSSRSGE